MTAAFTPSESSRNYEAVQTEAFLFYRSQGNKTDGQCSRAAAMAAKRWQRKNANALTLQIGKKTFTVADLSEASAVYQIERNKSGSGASRFPEGKVGEYRISYNGRVWLGEYQQGAKPVLEATAL